MSHYSLKQIVLNLDQIDLEQDYNIENHELWQREAAENLISILNRIGSLAKEYREKRKRLKSETRTVHDAVFISGGRGAGKTVFLKNAKSHWEKNKSQDLNLYFCDVIDPTLLINNDDFTYVVVAHLYNEVENKLNTVTKTDYRTEFYNTLRELAQGIGQESDYQDLVGIDRIIKYRSGVKVEALFHAYVEACINILKVDAIILPIDDVDMALNHAFDVLEVVRRMLGCPYIIPLVSGDERLYRHMVKNTFLTQTNNSNSDKLEEAESISISESLTDSYLAKVFPNNFRITLLSAEYLLPNLLIKESDNPTGILFTKYEEQLTDTFCHLSNGEENSNSWLLPSNSREVVQLLNLLPPSDLNKVASRDLWQNWKGWTITKQDGANYTNAVSVQKLISSTNQYLRLHELIAFNPLKQANDNIMIGVKDFYAEQKSVLKSIGANVESYESMIQHWKDKKTLRSMPPLEFYTKKFTVPKGEISSDNANDLLLAIYCLNEGYNKTGAKIRQVFFSRSFEILSLSLLTLNLEIEKDQWGGILKNVCGSQPFYSVYAFAPTKTINVEDGVSSSASPDDQEVNFDFSQLAMEIVEWQKSLKHQLPELNVALLIPLLHSVFNKVFTQLSILRENSKKTNFDEEHLTSLTKRFQYIFINTVASFLKQDGVVNANIALGAKTENVINYDKFRKQESVFTRNVEQYIGKDLLFFNVEVDTPDPDIEAASQGTNAESYYLSLSNKLDDHGVIDCSRKLLIYLSNHPLFALNIEGEKFKLESLPKKNTDTNRENNKIELSAINKFKIDNNLPKITSVVPHLRKKPDKVSMFSTLVEDELKEKKIKENQLKENHLKILKYLHSENAK